MSHTRERPGRRFGLRLRTSTRSVPLARHKYGIEKRQRELKKEKKKEEKRQRKLDRKTSHEGTDPDQAPEPGETPEAEPGL